MFITCIGATNIFEAAVICRRLDSVVRSRPGFWEVNKGDMETLRRGAHHYEALVLLEIQLDLVDLDLEEGIVVKIPRFDSVREAANDAVTSSHPTTSLSILDEITIEAQRIARLAKALGFGPPDAPFPKLSDEDIDWMAMEDVNTLEPLHLDPKPEDGHSKLAALHQAEDAGSGVKDAAYRSWLLTKEEHVVAILRSKIAKLRAQIATAKTSPIL